jgi:predicted phosphate transport protein (TIGR00153 family)
VSEQIGLLPYRTAAAGQVEVLLITSRDTGRWVVPKGNPMPGFAPHEAAAEEGWEEAGIRGIVCPTPLGRFRYWKRRRLRAPRHRTVALYSFLVTEQAAEWPERHQRVTQWFDLANAALAVAEPELRSLIAGFREPPRLTLSDRVLPRLQTKLRRRVPMLGWFQALLPKTGRFFELFEAHAATLTAGADSLARLLTADGEADRHIAAIIEQEHRADDITRDVLMDVRRIFVTPFDRSAITDLIGVMDDAIDQMHQTANTIRLYEVTAFEPQMRDMTGIIVEAARLIAEAMPLLRSVNGNAHRLHELTARIITIEGDADAIHADGLRALFQAKANAPMDFIIQREIYGHLERVVDRFEDVADEIQGLVIDHA